MKYSRLGMIVLSLSVALMSGCQQRLPGKTVTMQQINQLSALIASAEWLRDNCQRSDIPPRHVTENTAINMAKQRGWVISAISQQEINNAVEKRYLALSEDNALTDRKCAQLNKSAIPFIQQITSVEATGR